MLCCAGAGLPQPLTSRPRPVPGEYFLGLREFSGTGGALPRGVGRFADLGGGCREGNALAAPGEVRVNCAAHGSAENKSFQISGASNLSEIKEEAGRKLSSKKTCTLLQFSLGGWRRVRGGGDPTTPQLAGPWKPASFLFISYWKGLWVSTTNFPPPLLSAEWQIVSWKDDKVPLWLVKKKKKSNPCYYYSLGLKECSPLAHYYIHVESGDCRCRADLQSSLCFCSKTRNPWGEPGGSPMLLATASGFRIPQNSWREQHQVKLTAYTKPLVPKGGLSSVLPFVPFLDKKSHRVGPPKI